MARRARRAGAGAPSAAPRPQDVPACPLLARELNARTEAVIDRVLAGYDEGVPTPLPSPSAPAMRRMAIRLLRVLASGLETGRPAASTGRAAVAGFRGGLEGSAGARVVVEHTRVAIAVVQEAEAAVADGVVIEPLGLPTLHAVIDHALAAVTRGFEQAQPLRRTRAPGGASRG